MSDYAQLIRSEDGSHLIISGTGRAGTTLLVQLFTALGFDTGFTLEEALNTIDSIARAGLEFSLSESNLPYVIKSPWFSDDLEDAISKRDMKIRAAIVPVRDLREAASSRRYVFDKAQEAGKDPWSHPGSLWKVTRPEDQEQVLLLQFYKLMWSLITHEIPIYFLRFPRFAEDADYIYRQLNVIMRDHGISKRDVSRALRRVSRVELINRFSD